MGPVINENIFPCESSEKKPGIAGDILEELETYAEARAHAWPGGELEFHL